MAYQDLRLDVAGGVATITLDRPERMNAFTGPMGRSLGDAYRACDADDAVRVVIVTGAGRAFCAGADLAPGGDTFAKRDEPEFSAAGVEPPAFSVRKPVIAAVNGHAVGIGLTLAMQCDVRVVAREAKLAFAHCRRGVIPDAYSHWTVPRAIGFARTADLFLTGRTFTGEEAYQLWIASRVVPAADVLATARTIAEDIATNVAPLSAALCKRLLWEERSLTKAEVGKAETALHHVVMGRPDALEGVMAFVEKRPPRFALAVPRDWPREWPT